MEIVPYFDDYREAFIHCFTSYFLDDLKIGEEEPRMTPELLRTRICPHILGTIESGAVRMDLLIDGGELGGFSIYQIDTPESDWNRRPGWGFIREFWISGAFRRRGLGRTLAEHTEKRLFEMGAGGIYLTTDEGAPFWSACGYEDTGDKESNGNLIFEKHN